MSDSTNAAAVRDTVTNLLLLYVHALDRRQWDLFDEVFFDDALCGVGLEAIAWRTWRDTARKNFTNHLDHTHHQLSPTLINLQGTVAWCETYCTAHHLYADWKGQGPTDYSWHIRYQDRLVKENGKWKFQHRLLVLDWTSLAPVKVEPQH